MLFRSVLYGFTKLHTLNCKAQATHRCVCVGPRLNRLPTAVMRQTGILPATNKINPRIRKRECHETTIRYFLIQGQAAEVLTALTCTKKVSCPKPDRDTEQS